MASTQLPLRVRHTRPDLLWVFGQLSVEHLCRRCLGSQRPRAPPQPPSARVILPEVKRRAIHPTHCAGVNLGEANLKSIDKTGNPESSRAESQHVLGGRLNEVRNLSAARR
jgi:hypothetical protein